MGKNGVHAFSQSPLIGSLSNLQVTRTGIKSQMSSNLGRVGLFTVVLFALERSHWLHLFSVTTNSVFIKLTGDEDSHKVSDEFELWSYLTSPFGFTWFLSSEKKNDVSSFSQSPLIGSLSKLKVTSSNEFSNSGWIGLFTLELFALQRGNFFPYTYNGENDVATF